MAATGWTHIPIRDELAERLDTLCAKLHQKNGGKMPKRAPLVGEAVRAYLEKHGE